MDEEPEALPPSLCGSCLHAREVRGRREQRYLLCQNATVAAKYPHQPVLTCAGYAAAEKEEATRRARGQRHV
jgi:hypothetical protein